MSDSHCIIAITQDDRALVLHAPDWFYEHHKIIECEEIFEDGVPEEKGIYRCEFCEIFTPGTDVYGYSSDYEGNVGLGLKNCTIILLYGLQEASV